jgi:uncharacterized protein (TIGR02145 family)
MLKLFISLTVISTVIGCFDFGTGTDDDRENQSQDQSISSQRLSSSQVVTSSSSHEQVSSVISSSEELSSSSQASINSIPVLNDTTYYIIETTRDNYPLLNLYDADGDELEVTLLEASQDSVFILTFDKDKLYQRKYLNYDNQNHYELKVQVSDGIDSVVATISIEVLEAPALDPFVDPRNGEEYPLVAIGDKVWFAKNLNYDEGLGSKCIAQDCSTFGREYSIESALAGEFYDRFGNQGVCPDGFVIPIRPDFEDIRVYFEDQGTSSSLSYALKSTTGWGDKNGTNELGWNALNVKVDNNLNWNAATRFWSNSPEYGGAWYALTIDNTFEISNFYSDDKYPIRCIQEYETYSISVSGTFN